MEETKRLFRLFDENDDEVGRGVYHFKEQRVEVYFDGILYRFGSIGRVLLFDEVKSFAWCCPDGEFWEEVKE